MTAAAKYKPRHHPSGGPLKRHVTKAPSGRKNSLAPDNPAVVEGRTKYPHSVVDAEMSPRLLVDGFNSRKIGARVTKGRWKGSPIFTLTLEERATCPRSCAEWRTCYGNNMNWARRHRDDGWLMPMLAFEIEELARKHPNGFVVRLHVLGDFYSLEYVWFWQMMLNLHPALRIFGFTAHGSATRIGQAILEMFEGSDDRCWIRFSGEDGPLGSLVINGPSDSRHTLCPVQTGQTDCCGTCGLCWTMPSPIEFVRH